MGIYGRQNTVCRNPVINAIVDLNCTAALPFYSNKIVCSRIVISKLCAAAKAKNYLMLLHLERVEKGPPNKGPLETAL